MPELDVELPPGYRLVTFAERPDLVRPAQRLNGSVWPEFMTHSALVEAHWDLLEDPFGEFQLILLDADDRIVATNDSAPLTWSGDDADLPEEGWDGQFLRTIADLEAGRPGNTLGALEVVVDPRRRGERLAGVMLQAMRANAVAHGFGALIACVRPTDKHRYPLVPIERYAHWRRADGEPFDAWVRLHVRLGARVVRGAVHAMEITGTVAEWEDWAGMAFPESGDYVVPAALATVRIDREADWGRYLDPGVWLVHDLG